MVFDFTDLFLELSLGQYTEAQPAQPADPPELGAKSRLLLKKAVQFPSRRRRMGEQARPQGSDACRAGSTLVTGARSKSS